MNPLYIFKPNKKSSDKGEESVFHVGIINDNTTVYLEVYKEETISNVYKNGKCVLAYGGTTKECLKEIKNIL